MSFIYEVKLNPFYLTVENLCQIVRYKNTKSVFSKTMYGNHKLMYLVLYKEKLNLSWDRFIEHCNETHLYRQLGIKKMPVKSTFIKFVQRTPKNLFEEFVSACVKLLNLKDVIGAIDGTGFSNTNPSHYYQKRIDGAEVKNYTKTVFLTDIKTKLILGVQTQSDHTHETTHFKLMVEQLASCLKTILADKGYDSMSNRKFCWNQNIDVHIPFRKFSGQQRKYGLKDKYSAKRRRAIKKFDKTLYNKRALIESVNSAIKQTLGGFVRARSTSNQQKTVTIKAITYNIEHINRIIKINIKLEIQ
ncbi:MAG: transposase [archaeon]|jgi:transposase